MQDRQAKLYQVSAQKKLFIFFFAACGLLTSGGTPGDWQEKNGYSIGATAFQCGRVPGKLPVNPQLGGRGQDRECLAPTTELKTCASCLQCPLGLQSLPQVLFAGRNRSVLWSAALATWPKDVC